VLDLLFHWSPAKRRIAILQEGLKPYSHPVVHGPEHAYAYISLGVRPSLAWGYSGGAHEYHEIEEWDLWEVELPDKAECHVNPFWGREIVEIKCYTTISPDRVWLAGTRSTALAAIEVAQ
jgi:hypothetical protein